MRDSTARHARNSLRNVGGRWRVDNVLYSAPFQFTSGYGSDLRSSLKAIPACGR